MKYQLISDTGSHRLLLIFAGWGMDANVFSEIRRPGYDVMVVWDYRTFHIDWSVCECYEEICLMAWSMGVYAASQTTQAIDYKITCRIAVNGTLRPIDDTNGIPEAIYFGTLNGLNERTLAKFFRRMCDTAEDFKLFNQHKPQRPVEELRDELQAIADRQILHTSTHIHWDVAIISKNDRIFPPINQQHAWHSGDCTEGEATIVEMMTGGHFVDFSLLVDRYFIDKEAMQQRFAAGTASYEANADVQRQVVDIMIARLGRGIVRQLADYPGDILEIGSGSGELSRRLAAIAPKASLYLWDIAADCPAALRQRANFVRCDAELKLRSLESESLGFIFSASTIHWFNSPDNFMQQCARVLRPEGYAVLSTYCYGNLHQVTDITHNALPLLTAERWKFIARAAGLEIEDAYAFQRDLDFATAADALRHLKLTGVNSLGRTSRGEVNTREILRKFPMMLDGRYHLTYCPLILILRKA